MCLPHATAACPGTSQREKDHFLAGALWGATAHAFFADLPLSEKKIVN